MIHITLGNTHLLLLVLKQQNEILANLKENGLEDAQKENIGIPIQTMENYKQFISNLDDVDIKQTVVSTCTIVNVLKMFKIITLFMNNFL